MKNLITYEDFLKESVFADEGQVVIFPGRYMPIHNGHLAAFKRCFEEFGVPVIPIQIISKNEKSPFPDTLLQKIGDAITGEFSFLADFLIYPQSKKTVVPQMVLHVREELGYEPIGMGCGSDRVKSYEPQIKYINSEKSDVKTIQPFELKMVDVRLPDGPSGTKVREAIAAGDEDAFKRMTPSSIHRYYKELKKYL